jgi:hypothetical protein
MVHGVTQKPIEGVSMRATFDDEQALETRDTQYFEIMCNRGIYHKGWVAGTLHRLPGGEPMRDLEADIWELYDTNVDWTQSRDLAAERPDKLATLQRLFLIEAAKYNVLPLDDRSVERINPDTAGRPTLVHSTSQVLFGGMGRLSEATVLNIKNKSHSVTAGVHVPDDGGANGVIIAQGGRFGGWALYVPDGRIRYCYAVIWTALAIAPSKQHRPSSPHGPNTARPPRRARPRWAADRHNSVAVWAYSNPSGSRGT